jgi:hypothetical protein
MHHRPSGFSTPRRVRKRPPAPPLEAVAVPPAPERAPVRRGRAYAVVVRRRLARPWHRWWGRRCHGRLLLPPPDRAVRRQRRQPWMAHASRLQKVMRSAAPPAIKQMAPKNGIGFWRFRMVGDD